MRNTRDPTKQGDQRKEETCHLHHLQMDPVLPQNQISPFFNSREQKKGWVMLDILSCLSYCPKILFPDLWVAYKLINFYISSSYPPLSSSRRAGGSGGGGGGAGPRGPAEEKRGSGGGYRGPPAGSAPGHRPQGALGREEERGFRGGRSYSDNQR